MSGRVMPRDAIVQITEIPNIENSLKTVYNANTNSNDKISVIDEQNQYLKALEFPTISALRSYSGRKQGEIALCHGYYTEGDVGDIPKYYLSAVSPPGTYVDNGGNIIVPTGGDGSIAWLWGNIGIINAKWFGATGDGVFDNKSILEKASTIRSNIFFPGSGGEIYDFSSDPTLPSGTYCIFDKSGSYSGVTAEKLNAVIISGGQISGFPFSPEMRDKDIEIVAGTLRQNGSTRTQWDWIRDSLHEPIGVDDTSPAVASGTIVTIPYLKTYTKVISFIAAPDERLANALNLSVGASVGTSYSEIKASAELTLATHIKYNGATWVKTYGAGQGGASDHNVEITGITLAGANLTINHTWLPGANISVIGHTDNGAVTPYRPVVRSISNTSVVINFINAAGSFVSPADTNMSFLLTKNFAGGIVLDGTDNGDVLDLDLGNIWFYGIFQK